MSDLLDALETWGTTCWVAGCEWECGVHYSRGAAMDELNEHRAAAHYESDGSQ